MGDHLRVDAVLIRALPMRAVAEESAHSGDVAIGGKLVAAGCSRVELDEPMMGARASLYLWSSGGGDAGR
jgi:hypothetical protein